MIEYPLCKKCGASHKMGIEDREGNITPMDICYKCLWEPLKFNYVTQQIILQDEI